MINFEAFQNQQDLVIQRFRSASSRIRRAFTPPPRRGSENQDSGHSDVQMQIQENHVIQNASATSRWWTFLRSSCQSCTSRCKDIRSQLRCSRKSLLKQIAVMLVNVNQASVTIIAIINQRRRQVQGRNQPRQSRQMRQSRLQKNFVPFSCSVL